MQSDTSFYTPQQPILECSSFGYVYKIMVICSMLSLTAWGYRLVALHGWEWNNPITMFALSYGMLVYMTFILLTGKTTLTPTELRQDWFWRKSTPVNAITYVRFFRISGWEWLIAPRLYVQSGSGPLKAYHAYGPAMWAEFERWSISVKQAMNQHND